MTDVLLHNHDEVEEFKNATDVHIMNGVLTFYWRPPSGATKGVKFQTTVPFVVREEIGG
jgi:hypothetical protein